MKQKKFPVLPVLFVAGIGAATMLSAYFKPAVGDYAEIQQMRAEQERKKNADLPTTTGQRAESTSTDMKKGMEAALAAGASGNSNSERTPENKTPLIKKDVPKAQRDVAVNPAIPAGHWYREEFRDEKTTKGNNEPSNK